jgi:hypothetical protein
MQRETAFTVYIHTTDGQRFFLNTPLKGLCKESEVVFPHFKTRMFTRVDVDEQLAKAATSKRIADNG